MIKMNLKKLALQIHRDNVRKGFWKEPHNKGEKLFLCITELAEMCEADRKGKHGFIATFEASLKVQSKFRYSKKQAKEIKRDLFEKYMKDSPGDELADAFIRMLDYCRGFKIGIIQEHVEEQVERLESFQLKYENLGEELLNICGLIDSMHRGKAWEEWSYVRLILARFIWLSNRLGLPLEKHIKYKIWYNSTRPKMHGKKY